MDLDSEIVADPGLEAIIYLETKRHGLAFAISYLHWKPASAPATTEPHGADQQLHAAGQGPRPRAPVQPQGSAHSIAGTHQANADAAVLEELENMEWTIALTWARIQCGGYLEALANLKAAILALRHLLREGLASEPNADVQDPGGGNECAQPYFILRDMLVLQVSHEFFSFRQCRHASAWSMNLLNLQHDGIEEMIAEIWIKRCSHMPPQLL